MVLVLFWRALIGGDVLSSNDAMFFQAPWDVERPAGLTRPSNPLMQDPVLTMQPDLLITRRALASGQAPLWNPYQAAGRPLLASQQHAPLFPLNWPALVTDFWHSLAWTAALKLLVAALGMYVLTRWLGLPRGPCILAGTAFAFCAYMVSWVQYPQGTAIAMTPWVVWAAGRVGRLGGLMNTLGLALTVGLILVGGHPEMAAIGLMSAVVFAMFELFSDGPDRPAARSGRLLRAALLAGGALLGCALAAVMLLPLAEFLGVASSTSRGAAPLPWGVISSFLFPELWGRPDKALDFGPVNYTERTAYIGALPLLLAVGGLLSRRPSGQQVLWAALGLVAFFIAIDTPLPSLIKDLPGGTAVNLNRSLFVVAMALCVLAAIGLTRWLEADRSTQRRMLVVMGFCVLVPLIGVIAGVALVRHEAPFGHLGAALAQLPVIGRNETQKDMFKEAVAWRWLIFGGAGLGALLLVRRLPGRAVVAAVVFLVAVDVLSLDNGYVPAVSARVADPRVPPAILFMRAHAGHQRVSGAVATPPAPPGLSLSPALAERYGLADAQSYDLPVVDRYDTLWGAYGSPAGGYNPLAFEGPRAHAAMDTFAVRYVVAPTGQRGPSWLQPVAKQGDDLILENRTALPRAWVAYRWRRSPRESDAIATTLASSTLQLQREPVLETSSVSPIGAGPEPTPVSFVRDENERVVLRADAVRSGYLVLDDTYYPGWKAYVDGRSVRIVAANGAFRAVVLPAGRHTVTFSYEPASVRVGAVISLVCAGGIALALGVVLVRRRDRQSVQDDPRGVTAA